MIEQAELDRLQEWQIRDYLPELQTMVRLQNKMRDIMARIKLTAEERISLISELQIRFEKLKKESGVSSGALPFQPAFIAPPSPPPAEVFKPLADKGIRPDAALKVELNEKKPKENNKSGDASALSPIITRIIR